MKPAALTQAHAALDDARRAIGRMNAAASHSDMQDGWVSFVHSIHRLWKKLSNGAHGHRASEKWYNEKRDEQKTDAALQYVHQSRNADNYGLTEGTQASQTRFFSMAPVGEFRGIPIIAMPRTSYLVPVISRGVTYFPPRQSNQIDLIARGLEDDWSRPSSLAQLLLFYFDNMLEEADSLQKHA